MKIHSLQCELPTVVLVSKPFIQHDAHKCYYHQFRHLLNQSPLEWTTQRLHSCPVYCPTVGISSATFAVHLAYDHITAEILMLRCMHPSHTALCHTAMQFGIDGGEACCMKLQTAMNKTHDAAPHPSLYDEG